MPLAFTAMRGALLAAILVISLLPTAAHAEMVVSRAAGNDRIQTSVEASEQFRDAATDVVLATAFSFPDALAASALTNSLDAPLLLTNRDAVPDAITAELSRLGAEQVWILGGFNAVSEAVESDLRALGYDVTRLAGASRFETAKAIAIAAGPSRTGEAVLALGEHPDPNRAWPDAVASGSLAATPDQIPTLLTQPNSLPTATVEALEELGAQEVIILGSPATISDDVEATLKDRGYTTRRIVQNSRYDTSVALAEDSLARFDGSPRPAVFASGRAFPDALAAGSLAASLGAPLLLVPPTDQLPGSSEEFLRSNAAILDSGVLVGGPVAADDNIVAQLNAALQDQAAPDALASSGETVETVESDEQASSPPPADALEPATAPEEEQAEPLQTFTGNASWYGPGFEGNETANGEIFDSSQLTAAHLSLPFDSIVRVTNLENGDSVEVRINDRGPYHGDRVLDLSSAAADALHMKGDGVTSVRGEVLSHGS